MSCEQEFRNVMEELSELQVHLVGDAGRDRHEWRSAIQAVRHAHAEDRSELGDDIVDQIRHVIDRIRQKLA